MTLDTVTLAQVMGFQLCGFFNHLWGSPEAAATEFSYDPKILADRDSALSEAEGVHLLQTFIDNYDPIAARAGWRGKGLLACAVAVKSWIEHPGDTEEELIALLSVRRLLRATDTVTGTKDLSVIALDLQLEERLEELGMVNLR
jgi:hypothetical protein